MKKYLLFAAAFLLLAQTVQAASYTFTKDLQLGSKGSEVSMLQTWLLDHGYSIPSLKTNPGLLGTFGQQTKAAVQKLQKDSRLPSTGFVGPLTRNRLNEITVSIKATPLAVTTPGVISTPGAVGSITNALWSSPSGVEAYKGQSYDIVGYKVQASGSDMAIQNFSVDFDTRLWLYASAVTVKDDTGAVIGQVNNLSEGNFSHLTTGTQERLNVPVNGYVVKANTTRYLTVNITFLPSSDRSTGTVTVLGSQIRAIDGTGVATTQTNTGGTRTFHYNGSNGAQLVATIGATNPPQNFIEINSGTVSDPALLAVYSLKSQGQTTTLKSLKITLSISGNGNTSGTIANLFSSIGLKIGDTTVANGTIGTASGTAGGYQSAVVTFDSFTTPLQADTYTDLSIVARINADTSHRFEGIMASTTLDLTTSSNITVEDVSFSSITPPSIRLNSNIQLFTESNIIVSGMPTTTYGSPITFNQTTGSTTQNYTFTIPLMAAKNAIYISKTAYYAIATSTNPSGFTITPIDFSDDNTAGDGSTYFYIAPGQSKTFSVTYRATGLNTAAGMSQISALLYGTDSSASGGIMSSPQITSILTATLFH